MREPGRPLHHPMHVDDPTVVFALALGVGIVAQILAHHVRLPSIVLLFAFGVALGPDGAGWIVPDRLGPGLFSIVHLAVPIILFEGGLNLSIARLRREQAAIRRLVTWGVLITAVGGTLAAGLVMGWDWRLAALFGALIVVTGPTVVKPILRNVRLGTRLATVIEAEGVLNDPIGVILAAVTLQVIVLGTVVAGVAGIAGLLLRLAFGSVIGLVAGYALARVLRWRRLVPDEMINLLALAAVLVVFEFCESILSESGILAVTVAGIVIANVGTRMGDELKEFKEYLTVGFIGLLFVLLAADVRVDTVLALGWPGITVVALLALVVRPVCVFASTSGVDLGLRDRLFLAWLAPRGIVAAAVASLAASDLEGIGIVGGRDVRALVFLTIALTVVIEGGLAPLVARLLRVSAPGRDTVVILGANDLGLALAQVLGASETPVTFIDTNPAHVQAAQDRGYQTVFGNAMAERTLAQARLQQAKYVVALTPSDEVNTLFAREVVDRYRVPAALVAIGRAGGEVTPAHLERQRSRVLFDGPKDVERWAVRIRHRMARLVLCRYVGPPAPVQQGAAPDVRVPLPGTDPFLVLAVEREGTWEPMAVDTSLRRDMRGAALLHTEEGTNAVDALRRRGWELDETEAELAEDAVGLTPAEDAPGVPAPPRE